MAPVHLITFLLFVIELRYLSHTLDEDRWIRHRDRQSRRNYHLQRHSDESDDLTDEISDMSHHLRRHNGGHRWTRWRDEVVRLDPAPRKNVNQGRRSFHRNNRDRPLLSDEPRRAAGAKFGRSLSEILPDLGTLTPYLNGNLQIGPDINIRWNLGDLFTNERNWWTGPNVCKTESESETENKGARDISHHFVMSRTECDDTDTTYTCATSISLNGRTKIMTTSFECCHGFQRVEGEIGCSRAVELTDLITTAQNLNLTQLVKAVTSVGLEDLLRSGNYTIFAPTDEAFLEIIPQEKDDDFFNYYDNPEVVEVSPETMDMATAIEDILAAHVVKGFKKTANLGDEMLVDTLNTNAKIRINKYEVPKRLITANCQPLVSKDNLALNGVIHIVPKVLNPVEDTLLEVISKDPSLSTLKTVLAKTGLSTELGKVAGQHTLFAPTNAAFDKIDARKLDKLLGNSECLKKVLLNHMLPNVICSEILQGQVRSQNALENYLHINRTDDNKLFVEKAQVFSTDTLGTNGVLHKIDEVLIPDEALDILDIATKIGATELVRLIATAGLNKALQTADNITVLVPTNEAIQQLPADTLQELQSNPQALAKVLKYHIVPSEVSGRQLCHATELETLDSDKKIFVKDYSSLPFATKYVKTVQCAPIREINVEACNGVIHVVDKILMPPKGDVFDVLSQDAKFSTLVGLLKQSGLAEELQLSGPFTFFAPTNEAFNKVPRDVLQTLSLESEKERLQNLLKHHILRETLCCAGIFETSFYWAPRELMLDGSTVLISRNDVPKVNSIPIEACDQTASNGVVHAIGDIIPEAVEKYAGRIQSRLRDARGRRGRSRMGSLMGRLSDHFGRISDDFEWEFEWPDWMRRRGRIFV